MAFWGIEVKPGKPYIHQYDEEVGRLHISQATLGDYSSSKRILLQCNVGDKAPIYLCSLLPGKNDTCSLNLEFEEEDEVIFSVIGPHSVHLSGYYYGESNDQCGHDHESDDYGEDIVGTDSESMESSDYDTEDDDVDFIDHDMDLFPPSPVPNSGVRIEEIFEDEKPENDNDKRPKKKKSKLPGSGDNDTDQKQIVVNDSNILPVMESEDEDGFPIFTSDKKETSVINEENTEKTGKKGAEKASKKVGKDNDASLKIIKRKIQAAIEDGDQMRETGQLSGVSTDHEVNGKQSRKNKKKKIENEEKVKDSGNGSDVAVLVEETTTHVNQEVATENKNVEVPTGERKKNKKKKPEAKPLQERTFPNGLVIQELGMGRPDGRKASPGKKVSVHYIGKLKKNGTIFDSNIGKAPFKFRLGIGQVIKGWDVGVTGMRVGDKRRLTIPPAMGYGSKGAGRTIPPNSWLVFDVELVDVN